MNIVKGQFTFYKFLLFFIPLGFSAALTALSHVIINGTLARGYQADLIITAYAIAYSLFAMIERPINLIRQTSSALVKDQTSYKAMIGVTHYVVVGLVSITLMLAYTPLGVWFFFTLFGAEGEMLQAILNTYRILLLVSIISAYRCLYQGVIINRMEPKWLTVGMIVRLMVMAFMAFYFIWTNNVNSAMVGGLILLTGMIVEYVISVWKGRSLIIELPEVLEGHEIRHKSQIFRFYIPLLLSGGLAVFIMPAINALLGQSMNITLAISSFALAMSIQQFALSFFMYFHQIVLQFYKGHSRKILRWSFFLTLFPVISLGVFSFTPLSFWVLEHVMGADKALSEATIYVLRVWMLQPILVPWIDFCNGILMLRNKTNIMILSQLVNVSLVIAISVILVGQFPHWNGMIGALAISIGALGELLVIVYVINKYRDSLLLE